MDIGKVGHVEKIFDDPQGRCAHCDRTAGDKPAAIFEKFRHVQRRFRRRAERCPDMAVQNLSRVFFAHAAICIRFEHAGSVIVHLDNDVLAEQAGVPAFSGRNLVNIPDDLPVVQRNRIRGLRHLVVSCPPAA